MFKSKLFYKRAMKNMNDSKYSDAINNFNKSLKDYSRDVDFLYNFAYCYYQIGEYQECIVISNKIIDLNSSYEDAYNLKAGSLVHLNQFEEAFFTLENFAKEYNCSEFTLNHKNELEMLYNIHKKGKLTINIK